MSDAIYENLSITNSFIFGKVMQEPKLCKQFLEKLLGMKIKQINYPEREKEIGILPESHDIRLDVYADDGNDTFYDVEMQSYRKKDLPQRSRYYQAVLDINYLERGDDYDKLPKSFIIFVCDYDVFGWDIPLLRFRYCDEKYSDKVLNDGAYRIFLCRTPHFEDADINDDIKAFLRYMSGEKSDNIFVKELDRKVHEITKSEKWRRDKMAIRAEFMDARREGRELGRAEGRAEGREEGRAEGRAEGRVEGRQEAQKEIEAAKERAGLFENLKNIAEKRAEEAESENLRLRKILENAGLLPLQG